MVRTKLFEKRVELRTMVQIFQVAKFVEYYIVPKFPWHSHKMKIQIYIAAL